MQREVLGDRYQLIEPIGRGGMATVYRGLDLTMNRTIAVKVLREAYSMDPKFVTRFQREAKAAAALNHPNIVKVYDYGQSDGVYYIVMELIDGTDLRRYLRARNILKVDRAVIIAHDVALGLGAAHRRDIVNRDVKPQNILVGRDGSIKLTDFGIAMIYKDINTERLTTTGMTLGTVQYYAPEQAQGEIVTPSADVYALGIVMYEMLTGRTPFDGDTPVSVAMQHIQDAPIPPSQYNPEIPPALEEIIMRCLEKVPEMRYRNGTVLAQALESFMEDMFGDNASDQLAPGMPRTTVAGFNTVPSRPNNQRPNGPQISQPGISGVPGMPGTQNGQQGPLRPAASQPPRSVSSPNNMMPPISPAPPISPLPPSGFNQPNGQDINDARTIASNGIFSDQTIRMSDGAGASHSGFADMNGVNGANGTNGANGYNGYHNGNGYNGANGTNGNGANGYMAPGPEAMAYNQAGYVGSGSTRPYQRDALAGSNAKQGQRDARFTGLVTALILLVTLIFLGFCIFLAIQLGLIPFGPGKGTTATPTTVSQSATVPKLIGETLAKAEVDAKNAGFSIRVVGSVTANNAIVQSQDPRANSVTQHGTPISVTLNPVAVTPTVTVPSGLNDQPVVNAENTLKGSNISFTLVNAGPNVNIAENIVKGTNPAGGSSIPTSQQVQVYVWNCTICTSGTPTPAPTTAPIPTPSPTQGITPTPTTAPSPTPSPTPGTTPSPSPTPGTTPSPGPTPKVDPTP